MKHKYTVNPEICKNCVYSPPTIRVNEPVCNYVFMTYEIRPLGKSKYNKCPCFEKKDVPSIIVGTLE